ncbi:hypothetical protein [Rhodohalobacter mucosus]|uniref:Uncharacterized protein n=1 Tax=Rhodohalobacter mucosus TaxID=2079485 RepID=A0A316TMB4_9BACT|nr:hypothetical protein [Rhodohalobacter mucosus]PWN05540.1 hypothetical protein DDZ15_13110 [Rhodohalobacter mucosus]
MEKITQKDIDWLLNLDTGNAVGVGRKKGTQPVRSKKPLKIWLLGFVLSIAALLFFIILPFILLVRVSVYLNTVHGLHGWVSLAGGTALTAGIFSIYLMVLFRKINNRKRVLKISYLSTLFIVSGFSLFSLFYLSGVHAKSEDVQSLYRSMHPILRVAVSTTTLADGKLVLTDIGREESDYSRMGLPVNPRSLHYRQENGYYHAVDIRTIDRGLIRNGLLELAFSSMGFQTLRHTGTADHLHVELPVRE